MLLCDKETYKNLKNQLKELKLATSGEQGWNEGRLKDHNKPEFVKISDSNCAH